MKPGLINIQKLFVLKRAIYYTNTMNTFICFDWFA
uniref:Uncharacterized protein n=1 Tax=Anguilla anguilla TaxID=7936 RepID=A0A0E9THY3_ANGAN